MGGQQSSTHHSTRFLESASSPFPQGILLPPPPRRPVVVTIPQPTSSRKRALRAGDTFVAEVEDKKKIMVKVPEGATPGQQMQVLIPEYNQMISSTLTGPPPGCKVFLEHPIIVANVSYQIQGLAKELASSKKVTLLMQKAQRDLLRKAFAAGCNAVLGIHFNVTTTSSTSSSGATTLALVSAYGTPCVVAREGVLPAPGTAPSVASEMNASSAASGPVTGVQPGSPDSAMMTADGESVADAEDLASAQNVHDGDEGAVAAPLRSESSSSAS